jgi:hypothetical protein
VDVPENCMYYVGLGLEVPPKLGVKVLYVCVRAGCVGVFPSCGHRRRCTVQCLPIPFSTLCRHYVCLPVQHGRRYGCSCAVSETGKIAYAAPGAPQASRLHSGDVVGVGWLPGQSAVFFTVNGVIQEYVHAVHGVADLQDLCPIVAGWQGLIITANFGQGEFACKVWDCAVVSAPRLFFPVTLGKLECASH